jgi:phage tail sheath protein FI
MASSAIFNPKTPGVYITEVNAFPNSIVGVQTAVPAFIGYTEKAVVSGQSVLNVPILITSMADFILFFGGAPNPDFEINYLTDSTTNPDFTVQYQGQTLPYVITPGTKQFALYYSMQMFYSNGGSTCYVVSVGGYTSAGVVLKDLQTGLTSIANQVGPTMLVIPDAVYLSPDNSASPSTLVPASTDFNKIVQAMIEQAGDLQDRVAILDVYGATAVTQTNVSDGQYLPTCIDQFQVALEPLQSSAFPNYLSYGMAYFPWLNTTVVSASDIDYTFFDKSETIGSPHYSPSESPKITSELQEILSLFNYNQNPPTASATADAFSSVEDVIASIYEYTDQTKITSINNYLMNALPQYKQLLAIVAAKINILPPSGAMAGVFSLSDANQGVWNAPANMALFSTLSPTVNLTDTLQGPINVPLNGEAVDVIRAFPGRGTVVWGARTLDGNSPDWRYIQVRRTIIYIEQSIKQAINQYVFAPNVGATWVAVTQMISSFLQNLWSQGGLMGSKASDAFSVQCGVPTTMTAQDILNGVMVVQVTLQMVHPAEFIHLEFTQTMQGT